MALSGSRSTRIAEPDWQPVAEADCRTLPGSIRRWLLDGTSTSQLMFKAAGRPPEIRLIRQRWQRPQPGESRTLNLPARQYTFVREVEIICRNQPWMLARTVLPVAIVPRLRNRHLLGRRPLGKALFSDRSMRRSDFYFARLYGPFPGLSPSLPYPHRSWGRRSIFYLYGHALLLSEVFLPDFQNWLEGRP